MEFRRQPPTMPTGEPARWAALPRLCEHASAAVGPFGRSLLPRALADPVLRVLQHTADKGVVEAGGQRVDDSLLRLAARVVRAARLPAVQDERRDLRPHPEVPRIARKVNRI